MRPAITFLNIQLSNSRLSMNKETGKYFVDGSMEESKENIIKDEYEKEINLIYRSRQGLGNL